MIQISAANCQQIIFLPYSVEICCWLEDYYMPPNFTVILFIDETADVRKPVLRSYPFQDKSNNEIKSTNSRIIYLSANVISFICQDSLMIDYCLVQLLFILHFQVEDLVVFHVCCPSLQLDISTFLDTISNRKLQFFDTINLYDQISTDLDSQILRNVRQQISISDALSLYEWPILCFYLNHMLKYDIFQINKDGAISSVPNEYRSFIHQFAIPENYTATVLDPSQLCQGGANIYEFSKSDYPELPFEFIKKSVVVASDYLHSYDLKSGVFQFISTFKPHDKLTEYLFFEQVKCFFNFYLQIGFKMFKYYTKQIDWRYFIPGTKSHDKLAYSKTKLLLKNDFEFDDIDYLEYVTRYCHVKHKQPPKWYEELTPTGYSGFLLIGEFWQIDSCKTFKYSDDLRFDLCKEACKNMEYNIVKYVDTMDEVIENPKLFKQEQVKNEWNITHKQEETPVASRHASRHMEEAINVTLHQIESKKSFWHTLPQKSHFNTDREVIDTEKKLVFTKPINKVDDNEIIKKNAEIAYFGKVVEIPLISLEIASYYALKQDIKANITALDMEKMAELKEQEQFWYKKYILFNLQFESENLE